MTPLPLNAVVAAPDAGALAPRREPAAHNPQAPPFPLLLNAALQAPTQRQSATKSEDSSSGAESAGDADPAGEDAEANAGATGSAPAAAVGGAAEVAEPTRLAAAAASPASRTADAGNPMRVEKRLELVTPELRARVERVVERMRQEHGHRVEVVETVRHQARQDFLFQQGRTRPGPVVTWTRASNHTTGRAVDVVIDGSYDNPAAYARLARIAAEEGLQTLGPRDPGHLELPGGEGGHVRRILARHGPPSPSVDAAARASAPGEPRPVTLATPAVTAEPALPEVARLASPAVAAVARVATPGASGRGPARNGAQEPTPSSVEPVEAHRGAPVFAVSEALRNAFAGERAAAGTGATAAARIAHLLDLQSSQPIRPLSQVLLRLDGPEGADRIRLGLNGDSLDGVIALRDARTADRVASRLGELQHTLQQHGLDAESLRVRAVSSRDGLELPRTLASALDAELLRVAAARTAAEPAPRDRQPAAHDEPRHGSSDPRQRSRREPKGEHHT